MSAQSAQKHQEMRTVRAAGAHLTPAAVIWGNTDEGPSLASCRLTS